MVVREIAENEHVRQNRLATHITQTWEWGQFRLQTGVPKILRLGFFEGNDLKMGCQVFFHKTPYLNQLVAYLPRTQALDSNALKTVSDACRKEGAIFLKLEPETAMTLPQGQPILPKHNLVVDLSQSEDNLLSRMHEKTRYNIKLAQKTGVTVNPKTDGESLEAFIKLYDSTQKRQGFFAKSGDYIRTLWQTLAPAKMAYLLMAEIDNKPVAGGMFFHHNDTFSFPYGGWTAEHREKMPNNLLHFEAMKFAKDLGAKTYDFWSSYKNVPDKSDPWYETYVFKKGFGGEEVHYPGAYDIVFDSFNYSLINFANKIRFPFYKLKRALHG